ncbi:hypothetical protein [Frankia nepalensis]|uniref:Uncharacterized protein n=1 Tax=Frankia nepalensis TaxID=1836974 RepID=A0A937R8V8_9ACTN|nr:hypothetical protein [Frankia nepalensis]MBL7508777.1 hypothetical protein [Frankia nepalensis]MBL7627531.1 hypothetical protein [Frankia nepalensis]
MVLLPWADNDITGAETALDVLRDRGAVVAAALGLGLGVAVVLEMVLAAMASFGRSARGWRVVGCAAALCAVLAAVRCIVVVRSKTARAYMMDPAGNLFEPVASSRPGLGLLSATGLGLLLLAVHLAPLLGGARAHR